ncbi:peroxiredoxin [Schaalia canis]|uniref:thioredoxin-dependent peroxiredoxin n=1 Tax=Schaalia canis TaxID=100469 RepID=A0A3P1SC48_9ACTO|nr:peroxiredoxin [Schaalia canis]RRC94851.1 peroxiredoxin [Schaalia canis]
MTELVEGQKAPDFTLESTAGPITLSALLEQADKGVIVYFYPKASTPGCTTQACDFRDNLNSLLGAGYTVVGVSADSMEALERFAQKQSLNFPLATDPSKEMLTAWGVWGEKKNYGKIFQGIKRSTIVIGKDGVIVLAKYNVKATGHVARLRKELGIDQ